MRPHISIYVSNVAKTIEFYSKIFNEKPQKQTNDYAKFDLKKPALNFSFMSHPDGKISQVGHFGIEVDSTLEIISWKNKLIKLGIDGKEEMDTECCYAKQDKFWFSDPDGNEWEIFFVKKQLAVPSSNIKTACGPKSNCCV